MLREKEDSRVTDNNKVQKLERIKTCRDSSLQEVNGKEVVSNKFYVFLVVHDRDRHVRTCQTNGNVQLRGHARCFVCEPNIRELNAT